MSTVTRNSAQTTSYFIPGQPFLETFMPLSYSNQDHTFMGDNIIPVLKQQTWLLLHLQQSVFHSDNQPLQFCLFILETFIPHSKIYRATNNWQLAKMLAQPFYTCFPSHYTDQHKRLPFNSSFIKLLKLKTLLHLRYSPLFPTI